MGYACEKEARAHQLLLQMAMPTIIEDMNLRLDTEMRHLLEKNNDLWFNRTISYES
jgi:hypothetical protein